MASPLKKPFAPSCCAPAIGCATSETAPASTPFPIDFVAEERPADASFGLLVENKELKTSFAYTNQNRSNVRNDYFSLWI